CARVGSNSYSNFDYW
nr:immunoglobulin heavy chain junction region [Macaca mulatta]